MPKIILNNLKEHPLKQELQDLGIRQTDIGMSVGCSQAQMSFFLNGQKPMPEKTQSEIRKILDFVQRQQGAN